MGGFRMVQDVEGQNAVQWSFLSMGRCHRAWVGQSTVCQQWGKACFWIAYANMPHGYGREGEDCHLINYRYHRFGQILRQLQAENTCGNGRVLHLPETGAGNCDSTYVPNRNSQCIQSGHLSNW